MCKLGHYLFLFGAALLTACSGNETEETLQVKTSSGKEDEKKSFKEVKKKKIREEDVIWDPLEPWNRGVFVFNQAIEHIFWDPLITGYRYLMPPYGQIAVHNILEHIKIPVSMISSGFQGDGERLLTHFARFMCNTLFGLGGLIDVATDINLVAKPEDFGMLMKAYNIPSGCFIIIPFLGPSVSRDTIGKICSSAIYGVISPAAVLSYGAFGAENLNQRLIFKDSIDYVLEFSADPYAMIRRAYYESRGEFPDDFADEEDEDEDDTEDALPQKNAKEQKKSAPLVSRPVGSSLPKPLVSSKK